MKILSFGHIPSWAGGQQQSGLANVIYQLAKHMSDKEDVRMLLAATDVFVPQRQDGNLTVYGWTKSQLVRYALLHPLLSVCWLYVVVRAKLKFGPIVSIPGFFFKGLHLHRVISLTQPDVVHLHGMTACVYEKIIPSSIKVAVTMHGMIGNDKTVVNQKSIHDMEREVCMSERYSCIIFIAKKLIEEFKLVYGSVSSECVSIPNAFDGNTFNYVEHKAQNKLTLFTIASLSVTKGQVRVLEALTKTGLPYKYICAGPGSVELVEEYKSFAEKHNIDFEYVGAKSPSEIKEILSTSDYMIMASSSEGFGLVYLESIACGVPVILPKHLPIVQEEGIIRSGENALLLADSSSDAIAALLPQLQDMAFDHKKVSESIIDYSWSNIANNYIETFKHLS